MNIRCANCHDLIWVRTNATAGQEWTLGCPRCGQEYRLEGARHPNQKQLQQRARQYAEEHRIDLPSAYSVLLGIVSLEHVQEVCDIDSKLELFGSDTPPPTERPRQTSFDPSFKEAIEAGFLTPNQARQRGQREAFASRLAQRHSLSKELAYSVADNRTSLLEALRKRKSRAPITVKRLEGEGAGRSRLLLVAAVALVAILSGLVWHEQDPMSRLGSHRLGASRVKKDKLGRVVQVVGQDPHGVLVAYCRAGGQERALEALELVPAVPPVSSRVRTGLLKDLDDPDQLLTITIRHDRNIQWVAGDGRTPLDAMPFPAGTESPAQHP